MLLIRRPSDSAIEAFLLKQRDSRFSYPEVGFTNNEPPPGYNIDRNSAKLGEGLSTFQRAVAALQTWQMFKLGWVELFPPAAPIEAGSTVAVLVHHFGFYCLNACRIVYSFNEERRFGFAYGTLE